MKLSRFFPTWWPACLAAVWLALPHGLHAAPPAPTTSATNAPALEPEIPKAIYNTAGGSVRDPFFPQSRRLPMAVTNGAPVFDASVFSLKALSGTRQQRLALINNRTLAEGESGDVTTREGKIRIRCVAIRGDSVIIRVENQSDSIEVRFDDASKSKPMFIYK